MYESPNRGHLRTSHALSYNLQNHQIRHQATRKVSCQPGDCRWQLNLPQINIRNCTNTAILQIQVDLRSCGDTFIAFYFAGIIACGFSQERQILGTKYRITCIVTFIYNSDSAQTTFAYNLILQNQFIQVKCHDINTIMRFKALYSLDIM